MSKHTLNPGALAVATFEVAPAPAAVTASGDTNDYVCLTLTLLTEDCFGPSAGCTIETD
ncbi:MAG: hypothetical protein JO306_00070 [Gemmatimonadetes bacterium]|nr:hypothetical protein [Gemmatimonadota bacterium]